MTSRDRKRSRRVTYRIKRLEKKLRDNTITLEEFVYKRERLIMRWFCQSLAGLVHREVFGELKA